MLKNLLYGLIVSASLLSASPPGAQAEEARCVALGGTGLANAVDATNLVASLDGALAGGARAEIKAQTETPTGLAMDMEHYFFTDRGGLLRTQDKATLTAVPGKENVYMLEISYDVVESSGAFEGYKGSFQSFGLINLEIGQVVLRYKGEICK